MSSRSSVARLSWMAGAALLSSVVLAPSAVAVVPAAPAAAAELIAPATAPAGMTQPIYRVTNANGNTLLTPWRGEADNAVANLGWERSEVAFFAATTQVAGSVPVFRLYNPSTHSFLFTASPSERDSSAKYGFRYEKVAFYVPAWDRPGTTKIHRTHKVVGGTWRYRDVIGDAELAEVRADGWIRDVSPFRAVAPEPAPTPEPEATPEATPETSPAPEPAPAPEAAPEHPGDGDGVFSIVQFNDTQNDVFGDHQRALPARVDWILANEGEQDIRFAVHTGDVVNWWESRTGNAQYARADRWLQPLSDSSVPFAVAVGNHDTLAVADGQGWANSDPATGRSLASWGLRQTQLINEIFPASDFSNMRGQFEAGKFDNSFHTFTAEGADFLVLSLEMWPRTAALDWAERVVRDHPRHNVIVLNHSYLDGGANVQADNGGYGTLPSTAIRDRIVGRYPNVKLVLSGHAGTTNARIDAGPGGNVLSVLTNLAGTDRGELRLFRIDVAGGTVHSDLVHTAGDGSRGHNVVSAPISWIR